MASDNENVTDADGLALAVVDALFDAVQKFLDEAM